MGLSLDERIHSNPRLERWTNQFCFRYRLHYSLLGCHWMNESTRTWDSRDKLICSVSGTDCIIAYWAVTGWTNPLEPETNQFCFWYRLHYSLWGCHWMNDSTRTRDSRDELISSVSGTDCIIAYGAVTGWTNPLEPETREVNKSVLFLVQTAL